MLNLLTRYVKYMGTSLAGTLTDTLVLWLLSDFVFSEGYWREYVISPVISFQCAVMVNFTVSYFYVWRDRTKDSGIRHNFFRRFWVYDLSCSAVFLLRMGILLLIEKAFGWDVVICNLAAMCVSGIVNFSINNLLIFRKRR